MMQVSLHHRLTFFDALGSFLRFFWSWVGRDWLLAVATAAWQGKHMWFEW